MLFDRLARSARTTFVVAVASVILTSCGGEAPETAHVAWPSTAPERVLIENVAVFDSEALVVRPGRDVVIADRRIEAVRPHASQSAAEGARVIDGRGATLVPGLIDMHGHIAASTLPTWDFGLPTPEANLTGYAYSGVTTVFDPSDPSGDAFERRARVADHELVGPRIFTTGKMLTCPDGHPRALVQAFAPGWIAWWLEDQVATGIESIAEAQAEVDVLAEAGADAVKIAIDAIPLTAPTLRRELAQAVVARARDHGLRTVAHIGTTRDAIDAGEAGVALWVHGVYKERIPDAQIAQLASYGIPMVATIEVFDRYARGIRGPIQATRLERETVSPEVLERFHPIPDDFELGALASWIDIATESRVNQFDNLRRLRAAGVTILAGSDVQSGVFPGASLHRELANLVDAGMSPAEAIRAATLDPARFIANGGEPDAGIIAAGKRADFILVEGDPTRDIAALSNIREVFLDGVAIERAAVGANPEQVLGAASAAR
ncbi:MAG: amidohydrolase family protein [Myxococcota bacterium]|jgi:imidazolonepropionase-like amidohydrolase|nr:amidohydrolase family protein [Myxococcota bacterium]